MKWDCIILLKVHNVHMWHEREQVRLTDLVVNNLIFTNALPWHLTVTGTFIPVGTTMFVNVFSHGTMLMKSLDWWQACDRRWSFVSTPCRSSRSTRVSVPCSRDPRTSPDPAISAAATIDRTGKERCRQSYKFIPALLDASMSWLKLLNLTKVQREDIIIWDIINLCRDIF